MPLAVALTSDIAKNAGVAYVHYLSFMLCFGALVLERKLIKADPNRQEATAMVITVIVMASLPWLFLSVESCG